MKLRKIVSLVIPILLLFQLAVYANTGTESANPLLEQKILCTQSDPDRMLAYVVSDRSVFMVLDNKTPEKPVIMAQLDLEAQEKVTAMQIHDGFIYVTAGNRLQLIDISDPYHPSVSYFTEVENGESLAGLVICGNRAYLYDRRNIHVYSLENPALPGLLQSYEVNNPDSVCSISGIAVAEDIVYADFGAAGIHIFDFTDLNDIRYTGKLNPSGVSIFNADSLPMQQPESGTPAEKQGLEAGNKIAYLTIDDGPSRNNTPKNLDTLKKYGVKATFFVLPRKHLDDIYGRILEEGHVIGNHSYVHDYNYLFGSVDNFRNDVLEAQSFIYEKFQYKSTVYRFPGGTMGRSKNAVGERSKVLEELGYKYFDWNVTTADTDPNLKKIGNEGQIVEKLANNVINGANGRRKLIILMHDSAGKSYTAKALPKIIEGLQKQGYTFDVLTNY